MEKIIYRSFEESKKFVRSLNLKSTNQWREFCRTAKRPKDINSHPDRYFKNKEWVGWNDFLGSTNKQGGNRKYNINDDYFKKWSHNMAYILGFWYSDGYVDVKRNVFSITQHKKDRYILEKILLEMGCSEDCLKKHGDNNFCFKITSNEIVSDLKNIGKFNKKTYDIKFPVVPDEFMPDFIRGMWDGDGTVYLYRNGNYYSSSFGSASSCLIYGLKNYLNKNISDFNCYVYIHKKTNPKFYTIPVGTNDTRRLRDYLYENMDLNCLFLKRKRELFDKSGEINIASQNKTFLSYEEAEKLAKTNNIDTRDKWKLKCKQISEDLPVNPENTYKDKWINWETFLGTEYYSFNVARECVHKLKLKNQTEWVNYAKSEKRPRNIPSNPWSAYKGEYKNLADWLGKTP